MSEINEVNTEGPRAQRCSDSLVAVVSPAKTPTTRLGLFYRQDEQNIMEQRLPGKPSLDTLALMDTLFRGVASCL